MNTENTRECLCVGVNWARAVLYGTKSDYKPEPHPECKACQGTGVVSRSTYNQHMQE